MMVFEEAMIDGVMVLAIVVALAVLVYAVVGMIRDGIWQEAAPKELPAPARRRRVA